MQAFSFGQINVPGQKNYVFVDEHNRHRRLKVMRACEGCRRRKIKCDAATTNTWPCSACNRLKLHCIPPTMIDQDVSESDGGIEVQETSNYQFVDATGLATSQTQATLPADENKTYYGQTQNHNPAYQSATTSYTTPQIQAYPPSNQQEFYQNPYHLSNQTSLVGNIDGDQIFYGADTARAHNSAMMTAKLERNASETSDQGSFTAEGLSEQLGALKMDECGTAPYLRRPSKFVAEPAAPVSDKEIELPNLDSKYGSQIEIPPALMPSDERASRLLEVFFSEVHPYVPVVNRSHFYQQWQYDRSSISPLLLEAMFACAGRLSDDSGLSAQLLALADKHQDAFLDTPRLSTIQALLILLKAREAVPKRGYYYRSWMMCKTIASMAKDLDIHEHYATHISAQTCGSDLVECLNKTRIWQTLMVCEMMIGGPQGRYDFEVDLSSVDLSIRPPGPENDAFEEAISLQFAFFVRNVHNIRLVAQTYQEVKNTKDWGAHPKFVANNAVFDKWPEALPLPLQLCLSADGSPPHIPSHFIANMHSHYQLGRIMLQRPQLVAQKSFDSDSVWKHHMMDCYNSAKVLCRLQEAILSQFGLTGLLCMQRGINFTIYAILTCIMLHLVAITSPDPDLNSDAREFFTRHMRILEACIKAWPMQEMRVQIDALREAFSADKSKAFELKASFPYGTPSESYRSSPSVDPAYHSPPVSENEPVVPQRAQNYFFQPMTPPISAASRDSGFGSPYPPNNPGVTSTSNGANDGGAQYSTEYAQPTLTTAEDIQWNPTPIFQQWNTAFSIPQSAFAPAPSPTPSSQTSAFSSATGIQQSRASLTPPNTGVYMAQYSGPSHALSSASSDQASMIHTQRQQHYQHHPQQQQQQQQPQQQQQQTSQVPQTSYPASYVSPKEWQQSVASVFNPDGLKRRWNYAEVDTQLQKRLR